MMRFDIYDRVARASIPGVTKWSLRGYGTLTTTYVPLWHEGATYAFLQANMASPTISSSSANDTAAGTGARTVRISGVNASWVRQTEDLTLNGQTGVAIVNSYMTIDSMRVLTAGSGLTNAGNVFVGTGVITTGKPAVVHNRISSASTSAQTGLISASSWYVVPDNYSLHIVRARFCDASATAGGCIAKIESSENLGLLYPVWQEAFSNPNGVGDFTFTVPLVIPEKSQIIASLLASAGGANASCYLEGYLINESAENVALLF